MKFNGVCQGRAALDPRNHNIGHALGIAQGIQGHFPAPSSFCATKLQSFRAFRVEDLAQAIKRKRSAVKQQGIGQAAPVLLQYIA